MCLCFVYQNKFHVALSHEDGGLLFALPYHQNVLFIILRISIPLDLAHWIQFDNHHAIGLIKFLFEVISDLGSDVFYYPLAVIDLEERIL